MGLSVALRVVASRASDARVELAAQDVVSVTCDHNLGILHFAAKIPLTLAGVSTLIL